MLGRFVSATLFCGAFLVLTVDDASAASKTISQPMFNGNRLDWCLKWSSDCGKPAADAYCKSQGYQQAVDFFPDPRIGARSPTRLIGSGAICDLKHCDGFSKITCEKTPIVPAATLRRTTAELSDPNLVQKASLVAPLPPAKPLKLAANPIPPATPGTMPPLRKIEGYRPATASSDSFDASGPKPSKEPLKLTAVTPIAEPAKPETATAATEAKPPQPKPVPVITSSVADVAATATPKVFDKPMYNGKRLDWCLAWDKECGQIAADAFCKTNGFSKATAFNQDPHIGDAEPTRVITNGAVCDQALCNGFKEITCTM